MAFGNRNPNLKYDTADEKTRESIRATDRANSAASAMRGLRASSMAAEAMRSLPVARPWQDTLAEATRSGPMLGGGGPEPTERMAGVTGGGSSTAMMPPLSEAAQRRKDFGFSFSGDPNHVVTDAERRGSAFAPGRRTEFATGEEIQFADDDARRPMQLARQAEQDRQLARRTQELLAAKQAADAKAAMGFTEKYGVPYDPAAADFVRKAEREDAMDKDLNQAMSAAYARLVAGEYSEQDYTDAVRELAKQWGVRRNAPEGYFRSLQSQGLEGILGQ